MADIENWLADNYEALVADPNRAITYESIADSADGQGHKDLAAWARKRAVSQKKDVTPRDAKPVAGSVVREKK